MEYVAKYFYETWSMMTQLAPWLLIGFALAGIVSIFLRREMVGRMLGKKGFGSILRATLIGVPLPLCSCGVIPVTAAVREKGASKGATAAFLASTPETGVDSAIATWGMLGPLMAIVRVVLAFVTGILAGLFVQFVTRDEKDEASNVETPLEKNGKRPSIADGLKYAFITMPDEMAGSLVTGILLAGALSALLPEDFFASLGISGVLAYLVTTLVAIPLYVCSTGSIPLAAAMIHAGFSPGCALVFLIAGPATNVTTIVTMRRYLGTKAIAAYLFAIVLTAWSAGFFIDTIMGRETIMSDMPHTMSNTSLVGTVCATILSIMIIKGLFKRFITRHKKTCCCECKEKEPEEESCCCHCSDKTDGHD
jgi:uncharacterized protein